MADAFSITTPATSVALDTARQGETSFTVSNGSGRPLSARAYLAADAPAAAEWFSLVGEPVRAFETGGSQQYTVKVAVPATAPPGSYTFRLNVVGIENPDEEFAQGPSVAFQVSAAVVRPPVKKGYKVTVIGALVGALAGGALGLLPAIIFALTAGRAEDFSDIFGMVFAIIVLAVIFTPVGIWLGAVLGTWLALRSREYRYPGVTALAVAVLLIVTMGITFVLLSMLNLQGVLAQVLGLLFLAVAVAVAALASRAVILLFTTRQI